MRVPSSHTDLRKVFPEPGADDNTMKFFASAKAFLSSMKCFAIEHILGRQFKSFNGLEALGGRLATLPRTSCVSSARNSFAGTKSDGPRPSNEALSSLYLALLAREPDCDSGIGKRMSTKKKSTQSNPDSWTARWLSVHDKGPIWIRRVHCLLFWSPPSTGWYTCGTKLMVFF